MSSQASWNTDSKTPIGTGVYAVTRREQVAPLQFQTNRSLWWMMCHSLGLCYLPTEEFNNFLHDSQLRSSHRVID